MLAGVKTTWKKRAKKLKMDIPAVFLSLKKKETPFLAKALAGLAVCYALSPIDLIPDFIPVLGYLDDVLLLPALISVAIKLIPKEVFEQCQKEAAVFWSSEQKGKWYFAVPIVLIWLGVLGFVCWML